MKTNRWAWILVFLTATALTLAAQTETDKSDFEKIKTKAVAGDAEAQFIMGYWCETKGSDKAMALWSIPTSDTVIGGAFTSRDRIKFNEALSWYHKSAGQGYGKAQFALGLSFLWGVGGTRDPEPTEAVKWFCKAAEQGNADSQFYLGYCYHKGKGVAQDFVQAYRWYYIAATNGQPGAARSINDITSEMSSDQISLAKQATGVTEVQTQDFQSQADRNEYELVKKIAEEEGFQGRFAFQVRLGNFYLSGKGVDKNEAEAAKWFQKAAAQGNPDAQMALASMYVKGVGVSKDLVKAYAWFNLAATKLETAATARDALERKFTPDQISRAQQLTKELAFYVEATKAAPSVSPEKQTTKIDSPTATGTGFFISNDGYFISNNHVVKDATKVRIVTSAGTVDAKVIQTDAANDLALLKAEGKFASLPIAPSRKVALGNTVATVGFPDPGLQGFSPKLAKGEIASLSGAADDARYFQISVPVQPGNSGGALVDEHGNVVGIVSAKLNAAAALQSSGALPENVNYAVKSSFLLSFLESVPAVSAKLKDPLTADRKFEDVVKSAQDAAVLVLVY